MEFRYLTDRTPDGWAEWTAENATVTDRGVVIATDRSLDERRDETRLGVEAVDVDLDHCGTLYWLTPGMHVETYDPERGTERLLDVGLDGRFDSPRTLAVTEQGLYVADGTTGSVYAFSRNTLENRWVAETPFEDPVRMAGGRTDVYVLDSGTGTGAGFVVHVDVGGDRHIVVEGLDSPEDLAIDGAGTLYVLDHPDGDRADDDRPMLVRMYEAVGACDPVFSERDRVTCPAGTTCIDAVDEGTILVATCRDEDGRPSTTLYRYSFGHGDFGEAAERVATFGRRCSWVLQRTDDPDDGGGSRSFFALVPGENGTGGDVSLFEMPGRNRLNRRPFDAPARYDAVMVKRFDSGARGTRWHRVELDSDLGAPDTQVRLSYCATDRDTDLGDSRDFRLIEGIGETYASRLREADVMWVSELADLDPERVHEITDAGPSRAAEWIDAARGLLLEWCSVRSNPRDALLRSAEGRYLWVRIELVGGEFSSPRVESVRVFFPQQSYLRHLPAVYRTDAVSEDFLERYLSIFESILVGVEEGIEGVTRYLDARGTPAAHLAWLERWLAVDPDETWPEPVRRAFLSSAPELYKKRGTREGLTGMLDLYLDHVAVRPAFWSAAFERERERIADLQAERTEELVRGGMTEAEADEAAGRWAAEERARRERSFFLLESPDLDCIDSREARNPYAGVVDCPHCFLVLVRPFVDAEQMAAIQRIVESERPSHATGRAVALQSWTELDGNCYLGVNSVLPRRELVLERSGLGKDSVLLERGGRLNRERNGIS